jgi:HSP20 family molecular chaperone IbpA
MRIEEFMRDGELVVRAELPGIDPDKDVDITVDEGMLTISAHREAHAEQRHRSEFTYGELVRTLAMPNGIDASSVKASYQDGILEVSVRMPEQPRATTHIPVRRAS